MFLTATMDLLVFNKVGSPQYHLWVIGAVMFGLIVGTQKWRIVTIITLVTSSISWLLFPIFYGSLLNGAPLGVTLTILKNLGFVALLVIGNIQLTKLGTKTKRAVT
jgi:hypothetical protein